MKVWGQVKVEAEDLSQLWLSWSRWVPQLFALWQDDPGRFLNLALTESPVAFWPVAVSHFIFISSIPSSCQVLFLSFSLCCFFANCLSEIRLTWCVDFHQNDPHWTKTPKERIYEWIIPSRVCFRYDSNLMSLQQKGRNAWCLWPFKLKLEITIIGCHYKC